MLNKYGELEESTDLDESTDSSSSGSLLAPILAILVLVVIVSGVISVRNEGEIERLLDEADVLLSSGEVQQASVLFDKAVRDSGGNTFRERKDELRQRLKKAMPLTSDGPYNIVSGGQLLIYGEEAARVRIDVLVTSDPTSFKGRFSSQTLDVAAVTIEVSTGRKVPDLTKAGIVKGATVRCWGVLERSSDHWEVDANRWETIDATSG